MSLGQISLLGLFLPVSLRTPAGTGPHGWRDGRAEHQPSAKVLQGTQATTLGHGGVQGHTEGHLCTPAPASGLLLSGPNTDEKRLLLGWLPMCSSAMGGRLRGGGGDAAGAWWAGKLAAGASSPLY